MKDGKFHLRTFLDNFELYIAAICFIALTIMLTGQVVSRYVFKHSFTWMEEAATILFVWMIYLGVSSAVTKRKHLRIDFILDMVPFKAKRVMLILSNVIFAAFNVFISVIMFNVITLLGKSQTTMLHLPQKLVYSIIPIGLLLSVIRLAEDTVKLMKEDKANLGASKPSMDLDECERIYLQSQAAKQEGENK